MNSSEYTRRGFLKDVARATAGGMTAGSIVGAAASAFAQSDERPSAKAEPTPASEPLPIRRSQEKSRVVQTSLQNVLSGSQIRPALLDYMLSEAIMTLTGKNRIRDAWHAVFRADDVIGVKFNGTGAHELGITAIFARVLLNHLIDAGWDSKKVILIEVPESLRIGLKTAPASTEWSEKVVDFGSGKDRFAKVLEEITALINVPFVKDHNIAGMSGCLKNLSHGLIRRPALYHANHCCPFIADIVASEPIRSKIRLHLVNALRAVFDGGPSARPGKMWEPKSIYAAFDPVAADTVALELLNAERKRRNLPLLDSDEFPVPCLRDAVRRGLGNTSWDDIQYMQPRL